MPGYHLSRRVFLYTSTIGSAALGSAAFAAAKTTAGQADPVSDPVSGSTRGIQMFEQADLNFLTLFALGGVPYGAAEIGEIFATVDKINAAGVSYQSFCDNFIALADRVAALATEAEESGHMASARAAHLRAAQYYNQGLFVVLGTSTPEAEPALYGKMQAQWDAACQLFEPAFERVQIPYEDTHLPGYFLSGGDGPRPTVIIMNGSDGQFVDVYAFGGAAAIERGWNALIFEGPGQGSMLFERKIPFRPDWEKVIMPIVDFLVARPDVDSKRIALTGWSFGGLLVTRAAAFEDRLAAVVADPGFVDSWTAYPKELRDLIKNGADQETVDRIWQEEIVPGTPPESWFTLLKRSEIFGQEYLDGARENRMFSSFWDYAQIISQFNITDIAPKVNVPMLVTQYEGESFFPDGGKRLFDLLNAPKTFVEFTAAEGAGLHDGPLAPQLRNAVIFDWLDETLGTGLVH